MKKVFAVVVFVVFLSGAVAGWAEETTSEKVEVNIEYNGLKDAGQNLLSTTNLHTIYSVATYGVEKGFKQISQEKKAWQRGVEIIIEYRLAYGLSVLGHEGGHDYYADKNGVVNRSVNLYFSVNWNFLDGRTDYDSSYNNLSNTQKSKLNTAGLSWNNRAAAEVLLDNIGKEATLSEILWYSANKYYAPRYIAKTSSPDQTGSYGLSENDIAGWSRNVTSNDFRKMNNLYNDLKVGAIWQGLSLVAPAGTSLYYLFTGNTFRVPKIWFDTETELTDAGVMYALTGLFKHQGITYGVRLGYGKNRVEEKTMSQIEAEIKSIPLPIWDLKAKIKAGYADTLSVSWSIGFGLEKSFRKLAVGAEVNRYDGYHRYNPKASEGLAEMLTYLKFRF